MATSSSSASPTPQPESQNQPPPQRILVCGGGVIGACTAYFLSQKLNLKSTSSTKITLIEKSSIACAASGKAGGFLALDWCDGTPVSSLARASFTLHRSLSLHLNGPQSYGEVYICGMSKAEEVPDDPEEIGCDPDSIAMLHRIAGAVSSHLRKDEGAEVVAEQACFLPCTDDGLPVIGEIPGAAGCFVATGHSCWGILNGPATGASLAELVLDGKPTTVDLAPFSPSRFLSLRTRK